MSTSTFVTKLFSNHAEAMAFATFFRALTGRACIAVQRQIIVEKDDVAHALALQTAWQHGQEWRTNVDLEASRMIAAEFRNPSPAPPALRSLMSRVFSSKTRGQS